MENHGDPEPPKMSLPLAAIALGNVGSSEESAPAGCPMSTMPCAAVQVNACIPQLPATMLPSGVIDSTSPGASVLSPDSNLPDPSACQIAGQRSALLICAHPAATRPSSETTVARLAGGLLSPGYGSPRRCSGVMMPVPVAFQRNASAWHPFHTSPTS